ncbi:hypothetical protein [Staphylococcus intermedius]|uniref:Uncharacterized protein n=1 Tax=Staphylococcus intermedius NCTC 11048 TaxID=1141106 RepID=A0A380GBW3_STAIN|nr:hypothetical protein [Staphylococcus intermedius]PCF65431.1 hypothetical protein B5C04_05105 [Staphylococcus intermedius]PCF81109.1 hypothetical protein B4W74_05455 [Staphylococcus intermedius]PCF82391.1 hypothetical protein B4W70_05100 [Staphylococcus intermedius]PCF87092.1 hypothetical protein B4W75_08370 [Staphylococcus intermedius]PCF87650.1 hypothetical protein B4W76_04495 [Staphylococcus intermedius]
MKIKIVGYHGTTQESANSIIKESSFKKSTKSNEWLGHGVYFYELLEKAQWWCKGKVNPTIIETLILVDEDKLINLDRPSEEDKLGEFISVMDKEGRFVFDKDKAKRRCQIMNMYMLYVEAQVITATLISTNKKFKDMFMDMGYVRTVKQICVFDTNCIVYNELRIVE